MAGGRILALAALIEITGGAVSGAYGQSTPIPPPLPEAPPTDKLCNLTGTTAAAFEPQVAKIPGIERGPDERGYSVYFDAKATRIWNFTTAAIPGHPAAICRTIVSKGAGSEVQMEITCDGSKADCDTIARSFMDLNRRVIGEMR